VGPRAVLGVVVVVVREEYVDKIIRLNYTCWTIRTALKGKARLESQLIYKIMAVPTTATHGSETWNVKKIHETRIQPAEVNLLRTVAGYTNTDHQCNTEIKKKLKPLT
jgi:hypothetical protein